jgi:leucyl-tRNA synthetase
MIRMGGSKMSKSKGNLVAPAKYLDTVGADALRLFHLFVGPPADDVDWTDQTDEVIAGCARFLQRIWRLAVDAGGDGLRRAPAGEPPVAPEELARETHRLVARVSDDYDRWSYNTAVAACMEFTNLLQRYAASGHGDDEQFAAAVDALLLLMAPMAPHVTAEMWERRHGPGAHVHRQPWPQADPAMLGRARQTMVVQVNGKVRDRLDVDAGVDEGEMERLALASPRVQAVLDGRAPKKVVARPPKLVNLVV